MHEKGYDMKSVNSWIYSWLMRITIDLQFWFTGTKPKASALFLTKVLGDRYDKNLKY